MTTLKPFEASDYLSDEATIAELLNVALKDKNPDVFLAALAAVAKARGMTRVARDSGMGRESLYKALAPGAKPRYDTLLKLIEALGVELVVQSSEPTSANSRLPVEPGTAAVKAPKAVDHS